MTTSVLLKRFASDPWNNGEVCRSLGDECWYIGDPGTLAVVNTAEKYSFAIAKFINSAKSPSDRAQLVESLGAQLHATLRNKYWGFFGSWGSINIGEELNRKKNDLVTGGMNRLMSEVYNDLCTNPTENNYSSIKRGNALTAIEAFRALPEQGRRFANATLFAIKTSKSAGNFFNQMRYDPSIAKPNIRDAVNAQAIQALVNLILLGSIEALTATGHNSWLPW
jgi:hypothetical protein